MIYRQDILGLRGIAVLGVIFFHVGFDWAAGGFLGVEVFFVISGFLMHQIYYSRLHGLRDVFDFLAKRFWRIFPALFSVVFICTLCAWTILEPIELKRYGQSVVASLLFANNILLELTSNYFDFNTQLKPLVHTWSLGVEAQFYLLFAIFLVFFKRSLFFVFGIVFAFSFLAWWNFYFENTSFSFFSIACRIWILLLGSFVSFFIFRESYLKISERFKAFCSDLGLVFIIGSFIWFDPASIFSRTLILGAVVGAGLILFGGGQRGISVALLSNRYLGFFGLISFSLYLWHQPILAFIEIYYIEFLPDRALLLGFFASIAVGWVSFKLIERPFQSKTLRSKRIVLFGFSGGTFILLGVGLWFHLSSGLPSRFEGLPESYRQIPAGDWSLIRRRCESIDDVIEKLTICYPTKSGGDQIDLLVYGDSHAESLVASLVERFGENANVAFVKNPYCHIVDTYHNVTQTRENFDRCQNAKESLNAFLQKTLPKTIVISVRWTTQIWPIEGSYETPHFNNGEGGVETHPTYRFATGEPNKPDFSSNGKKLALFSFLDQFRFKGQKLVIVGPVPEVGWNVQHYIYRSFLRDGVVPNELTTSKERFLERNNFVLSAFDEYLEANQDNINIVFPHQILCNNQRCFAIRDSQAYYFDDDHLSKKGADDLVSIFD